MPKKPAKSKYDTIFEKELLPHVGALQTFAYHLTYNQEDADDLVQETYLIAYRFIDKYDEGTNAKAWLFKILKNSYINEYRRKARTPAKVDLEDYVTFHDTDEAAQVGNLDLREEIFEGMLGDELTKAIN